MQDQVLPKSRLRQQDRDPARFILDNRGWRVWCRWNREISAKFADGSSRVLWRIEPTPEDPGRWDFGAWGIQINELTREMAKRLPLTDARLRPDVRLFEHGFSYKANEEKERLEQKQREERQSAIDMGRPWQPRWFTYEVIEQADGCPALSVDTKEATGRPGRPGPGRTT
eukprot:jgi/Botrbrau1/11965/Bobra.0115s0001.1